MRELNWEELKNSGDGCSVGEGSLDVSHILAATPTEETGNHPIYIEETYSEGSADEDFDAKADLKKRRKASASKARPSYLRLYFPAIMLIFALLLVFLYVLFAKIGASGRGSFALQFVQGKSPLEFSSLFYIFFFLPAILLLYYLIPGRYGKPVVLLIASLLFYSFAQPIYLTVLLIACFFNYVAGMELSEREGRTVGKIVIGIFGIAGNLLLPILFVWLPWLRSLTDGGEKVPNIALPLGLMFLTLRGIAYLTDIWRGNGAAETDFFLFALYYTFFPTIALGPIDHYEKFQPTFDKIFSKKRESNLSIFCSGVERFLFGFAKKTILASPLYILTIRIRQVPSEENTVFLAWILALTYALWLFLELSAYADMAVGTARMLGFRISESFNQPFLSLSVGDFCQRWQITVTGWLRENICQPIFGQSAGLPRRILGILPAAGLFAILHGTNLAYFVLAGYMGILLILDYGAVGRFFKRFPDALRWLFTAILLLIAAAILLGASSANVFSPVFALFGGVQGGVANATMLYLLRTHVVLLAISIAAASGLFWMIYRWIRRKVPVAAIVLLVILFGLAITAGIGSAAPDTFMRIALGTT